MFYQLPRADLPTVHVALRIHCDTFRCAGSVQFKGVWDAVQDTAILEAAYSDTQGRTACPHGNGRIVGKVDSAGLNARAMLS